ncbi:MAG: hypothetical protein AAF720_10165 [Pseudomonadota bacterium]
MSDTEKLKPLGEVRMSAAVGAALAVHTGLALVWTGAAADRISQLERRADATSVIIERTARLDEQMISARASLARIEKKLDHMEITSGKN